METSGMDTVQEPNQPNEGEEKPKVPAPAPKTPVSTDKPAKAPPPSEHP